MPAAGVVMVIAVVLIVLALVYYLLSTIVALRKITKGLDEVIADVSGIVEKSAPVNGIVTAINEQLDAGVDLLEGLLVKKTGLVDAVGLVESVYPGSGRGGLPEVPRVDDADLAPDRRGLHEGHAHAGATRPRGADRRCKPERPGAARHRERQPRRAPPLSRTAPDRAREDAAVAGDRHRLPRAVRAARRHRQAS